MAGVIGRQNVRHASRTSCHVASGLQTTGLDNSNFEVKQTADGVLSCKAGASMACCVVTALPVKCLRSWGLGGGGWNCMGLQALGQRALGRVPGQVADCLDCAAGCQSSRQFMMNHQWQST
jgi:hypothetical protein